MLDSIAAGARPLLVVCTVILLSACGVAPVEPTSVDPAEVDAGRDAETAQPSSTDGVSPLVLFAQPANEAEVRPDVVVKLMFNEPMNTIPTTAAIAVSTKLGEPVDGQFAWDIGGMVVAFRPTVALEPGAYQIVVDETAAGADGDRLAEPYYVSFFVIPDPGDSKYETDGG